MGSLICHANSSVSLAALDVYVVHTGCAMRH
jgi:hypothetical protein